MYDTGVCSRTVTVSKLVSELLSKSSGTWLLVTTELQIHTIPDMVANNAVDVLACPKKVSF